jgi:hypothetical protein
MTTKILSGIYNTTYNLTSPVSVLSITATGYLGEGVTATGLGSYRIINNGGILGDMQGVELAGGGTVINTGSIVSTSSTAGTGVILGGGGTITNGGTGATTALIQGYYGVEISGQAGTLTNDGTILGTGKYGVDLAAGGVITNGGVGAAQALIKGNDAIVSAVTATLTNSGTVLGTGTMAMGV